MISIIIPVYNGEKYISQCVNMLQKQSYSDFEAIFINDGSRDGTEAELNKAASADSRIRFYSKINEGVSVARNYGVSQATGDYVLFIDVDDYVYPDHLESLYNILVENGADVAVGNYYKLLVNEDKPTLDRESHTEVYTGREAAERMLYRKGLNGYPVLKLIKIELARKNAFLKGIAYGEDSIYVYNLYLLANKVAYTDKVTYLYYQQPTSANHNMRYGEIEPSWNAAYNEYLMSEVTKANSLEDAARAKLFVLATDFACRLNKQKEYKAVRKELLVFIKTNAKSIWRDKKCKKMNRYMAFIGRISARLLVRFSLIFLFMKRKMKFELRHSL